MQQLGIVPYSRQTVESLRYGDAICTWDRQRRAVIECAHNEHSLSVLRDAELGSIEDLRWSKLVSCGSQALKYPRAQRFESRFQQTGHIFNTKGPRAQIGDQGDENL
jgi:hypothetical protein